ncbi:MAG: FtsQ-type POTRA domain-containing protein [Pseudonocardiaceae bacterium]
MRTDGPGASGRQSGAGGQSGRDANRPLAALRARRAASRGRSAAQVASRSRPAPRHAAASRVSRGTAASAAVAAQPAGPPRSWWPRTWWPWLVAGLAMLTLLGGLAWVLLGSALFAARSVQVVGTGELPAEVVRVAAAVRLGTPMMRLDTKAIETRVAALPRVASVQVRCDVDGTVRIEVTERTPVAVVRRGDGVHLVDDIGTDYAVVPVGPPGLPELRVARLGPRDAATVAALTVLRELPEWLRVQVRSLAARSPAAVVLKLGTERLGSGRPEASRRGDTREVRWGGAEQSDRKAAVLAALLSQPGTLYDVSTLTLPTIT